jgi:hypothetical protein
MSVLFTLFIALFLGVFPGHIIANSATMSATVIKAKPEAWVLPVEGPKRALRAGDMLLTGDRVETNAKGQVQLVLVDGTELVVKRNSLLILKKLGESGSGGTVLKLMRGLLQAAVRKVTIDALQVETMNSVCGVKGTRFQVEAEEGQSELKVLEGLVEMRSLDGGQSVMVSAGQAAAAYGDKVEKARTMGRDEMQKLRKSYQAQVQEAKKGYLDRVQKSREQQKNKP